MLCFVATLGYYCRALMSFWSLPTTRTTGLTGAWNGPKNVNSKNKEEGKSHVSCPSFRNLKVLRVSYFVLPILLRACLVFFFSTSFWFTTTRRAIIGGGEECYDGALAGGAGATSAVGV